MHSKLNALGLWLRWKLWSCQWRIGYSFAEIFTLAEKIQNNQCAQHTILPTVFRSCRCVLHSTISRVPPLLCSLAFCHSGGAPVDYRWQHFFATKFLELFYLGQGPLGPNAKSDPYITRKTSILFIWHQDHPDLFSRFLKKASVVRFGHS